MGEHFDIIKNAVTMRQVVDYYGLPINRAGFIKCPFHSEKSASLKIYDGNRGFHCHACSISGSVIDFVSKYDNITPLEAVKRLNDIFAVGIEFDAPLSEFERLWHSVKRLTGELSELEQEGKAAVVYNQIALIFDVPLKDLGKMRCDYLEKLKELNQSKIKLFGGKFSKDISEYLDTVVRSDVDRNMVKHYADMKNGIYDDWGS